MHYSLVSRRIIPLKFSSWNIICFGRKESIKVQNFECYNESSTNSSCHYWNHKVRVYSGFALLFCVMKGNSSVFFSSNRIYFGQQEPLEVKFSDFRVVGWKFTKLLMPYLKTEIIFSLNFTSFFSVMKNNSSVLF